MSLPNFDKIAIDDSELTQIKLNPHEHLVDMTFACLANGYHQIKSWPAWLRRLFVGSSAMEYQMTLRFSGVSNLRINWQDTHAPMTEEQFFTHGNPLLSQVDITPTSTASTKIHFEFDDGEISFAFENCVQHMAECGDGKTT